MRSVRRSNDSMTETEVPGPVPRLELAEWRSHNVVAGITWRGTGEPFDLGLSGTRTPVSHVMANWQRLVESFPEFRSVTLARQVHGTEIRWQEPGCGLVVQQGIDGHAVEEPGALIAVTVADCIPVYLVDPMDRRAALVHAGWRGTAAGILPKAIAKLTARGSHVENLLVHCGIGICGRCYEVGSEVLEAVGLPSEPTGSGFLDLRQVLARQAKEAGVSHVSTSDHCSAHETPLFFSHRGSGGLDGRMVGYLGLLG